jgi:hypothetical protein
MNRMRDIESGYLVNCIDLGHFGFRRVLRLSNIPGNSTVIQDFFSLFSIIIPVGFYHCFLRLPVAT